MNAFYRHNAYQGASALLMVVAIGAATLVMATSVAFLSTGELELAVLSRIQEQTRTEGENCVEEALAQLRVQLREGNVNLAEQFLNEETVGIDCVWQVEDLGANTYQLHATGTEGIYFQKRTIDMVYSLEKGIEIIRWEE